jgi:hypothetical protein
MCHLIHTTTPQLYLLKITSALQFSRFRSEHNSLRCCQTSLFSNFSCCWVIFMEKLMTARVYFGFRTACRTQGPHQIRCYVRNESPQNGTNTFIDSTTLLNPVCSLQNYWRKVMVTVVKSENSNCLTSRLSGVLELHIQTDGEYQQLQVEIGRGWYPWNADWLAASRSASSDPSDV